MSTCTVDRMKELKEFDETKAGVKGLVELGITKIPNIFVHPYEHLPKPNDGLDMTNVTIPIIDLKDVNYSLSRRSKIVDEVRKACSSWGIFQVINHGIPIRVLDDMLQGSKDFHEQDNVVKAQVYSRDYMKKVKFFSNYNLYNRGAAIWRDTLSCVLDDTLHPSEIPDICRDVILVYRKYILDVAETLCELFCESLGIKSEYMKCMKYSKTKYLAAQYYPPCPEPELTFGTARHTDPSFFTILLQDSNGGLQVVHNGRWINVSPIHGALEVNIGDFWQVLSNDIFQSVEHRVLANRGGPRVSVAMFISPCFDEKELYNPIMDIISDENPAKFQVFSMSDYRNYYNSKEPTESALSHFRVLSTK